MAALTWKTRPTVLRASTAALTVSAARQPVLASHGRFTRGPGVVVSINEGKWRSVIARSPSVGSFHSRWRRCPVSRLRRLRDLASGRAQARLQRRGEGWVVGFWWSTIAIDAGERSPSYARDLPGRVMAISWMITSFVRLRLHRPHPARAGPAGLQGVVRGCDDVPFPFRGGAWQARGGGQSGPATNIPPHLASSQDGLAALQAGAIDASYTTTTGDPVDRIPGRPARLQLRHRGTQERGHGRHQLPFGGGAAPLAGGLIAQSRRIGKPRQPARGLFSSGRDSKRYVLERRRHVLRARQLRGLIHLGLDRREQRRDDAGPARDRVALVARLLEEIRGGNPLAQRRRHRDHVEPVAVAGEIHHLELGRGQWRLVALAAREQHGVEQLLGLQQRTDVAIEDRRMDAEPAGRGLGELVVLAPLRSAPFGRTRSCGGAPRSSAPSPSSASPVSSPACLPQHLDELIAMLGHQPDAVGAQELIVADGRRDRPRARPRMRQSGLHVVGAVAAGLEGIDANDLILGQAGGRRDLRVGALECDLALRPLRHEAELLGGRLEKIGHHRNVGLARLGRVGIGCGRIDRPRRPLVDRRLGQHVVVEPDRLVVATLGDCARAASR